MTLMVPGSYFASAHAVTVMLAVAVLALSSFSLTVASVRKLLRD